MANLNGQTNGTAIPDAIVATLPTSAEYEALKAEVARQQAEIARMQREAEEREDKQEKELEIRFSEKSDVISVYNLGRYPLSLYPWQWYRLFKAIERVKQFMVKNWDKVNVANKDGVKMYRRASKIADYLGIEVKELDR